MSVRTDPYDILGVARDADLAEIRAAFRTQARRLHPDAGGGADEMADLNRAHGLLTDRRRRARYDATGQDEAASPDAKQARALATIAGWLNEFLAAGLSTDPVEAMRAAAWGEIEAFKDKRRGLQKQERRAEALSCAFAGGLAGPAMNRMVEAHRAGLQAGLAVCLDGIGHFEDVLALLAGVRFAPPAAEKRGGRRTGDDGGLLLQDAAGPSASGTSQASS